MKVLVVVAAVVASVALASPAAAEAAAKKPKQVAKPAPVVAVQPSPQLPPEAVTLAPDANEVQFGGHAAGTDPDPFIRLMILRDPRPYQTN
jgi:hypothetical protein